MVLVNALDLNVCRHEHDYVAERDRIQSLLKVLMSNIAEIEEQESSLCCSESCIAHMIQPADWITKEISKEHSRECRIYTSPLSGNRYKNVARAPFSA